MFTEGWSIYLATRKKNDQIFNHYLMRPLAGFAVAAFAKTPVTPNQLTLLGLVVFVVAALLLAVLGGFVGGLIAIGVLELSYLLDCCDGMLARHKKIASKEGHLFDFFTDEIKAVLLVAALGIRAYHFGGLGPSLQPWRGEWFLLTTVAGVAVISSATSLTNFVRRPELTGKETPVEAHYETVQAQKPRSLVGKAANLVMMLLRFLNHYPSHIYFFALAGHLELFFFVYIAINALYLARGWLGLLIRFGR